MWDMYRDNTALVGHMQPIMRYEMVQIAFNILCQAACTKQGGPMYSKSMHEAECKPFPQCLPTLHQNSDQLHNLYTVRCVCKRTKVSAHMHVPSAICAVQHVIHAIGNGKHEMTAHLATPSDLGKDCASVMM